MQNIPRKFYFGFIVLKKLYFFDQSNFNFYRLSFTDDAQKNSTENNYPVVNFANFNLRTGRPSGRFNLTKFDGKFEQVIGDIYGIDASRMPKHKIIYTIIEPTQTNPNWTLIHGNYINT